MTDENTLLNSDLESRYEKYKGIIKNFGKTGSACN